MSHHQRRPSLFWPLVLIAVGSIFLLSNLGILPPNAIDLLWRFWPLVLIIIGVDILLGRRSAIGSIITSLLTIALIAGALAFVFAARSMPQLVQNIDLGELKHETLRAPMDGVQTATVAIDWSSAPGQLSALTDSNSLLEGDLKYYGTLFFENTGDDTHRNISIDTRIEQFFISAGNLISSNDRRWNIRLNPRAEFDLNLDVGSGPVILNLRDLRISALNIDGGSGPLRLTLPQAGQVFSYINGGSGPISITLPETMEAKITLDKGSGPFVPGRRLHQGASEWDDVQVWLTDDFTGADNYIELEVDQGSGPLQMK